MSAELTVKEQEYREEIEQNLRAYKARQRAIALTFWGVYLAGWCSAIYLCYRSI